MRVAIYARVSTGERRNGNQDPETQLMQLREWCANSGHEIVAEYVERVSGGKNGDARPRFAAMMADAYQRKFDIVLCLSLDRFSREGMLPTVRYLRQLAACGVGFHSYTEPMLSTDNAMVRDIVLAVMAGLAKQERTRHVERVKAGLERARKCGTKSGRPIGRAPLPPDKVEAIKAELAKGTGIVKTARLCGTGVSAVQRIKRDMTAS